MYTRKVFCYLIYEVRSAHFWESSVFIRGISIIYHFVHKKGALLLAVVRFILHDFWESSVLIWGISIIYYFVFKKGPMFFFVVRFVLHTFGNFSTHLGNLNNLSLCPQERSSAMAVVRFVLHIFGNLRYSFGESQ